MAENQHKLIKGYRDLTAEEIAGELQAQQAFMALIRSIARPTTF